MIVECKRCETAFRLDESLVKPGGSKVRCSVCKNVFMVYPPRKDKDPSLSKDLPPELEEDYTETAALSQTRQEAEEQVQKAEEESEFDMAFKEFLEEDITEKTATDLANAEALPEVEGTTGAVSLKEEKAKKGKGMRIRPLPLVLALVLLFIIGAGVVYYLFPQFIPEPLSFLKPASTEQLNDPGIRRLSFSRVSGSFVQSDKAGQLFVIRGMVKNEYSKPRSHILVKGAILDDKGQVVKSEMAYAGNVLTEKQIKGMGLDAIQKALKNRLGRQNMNVNVPPGASIPFTIVIGNLPPNLSEFTVEAVRSSPGR